MDNTINTIFTLIGVFILLYIFIGILLILSGNPVEAEQWFKILLG